jgi:hypothetical protein
MRHAPITATAEGGQIGELRILLRVALTGIGTGAAVNSARPDA